MTTTAEAAPSTPTVPALAGLHHLRLTVADIVASETWCTKVLGPVRAFVDPHGTGDGRAVMMTRPTPGPFVTVDHHRMTDPKRFSPLRTGFDHLEFGLASREVINERINHLDTVGVQRQALFESAEPVPHALVVLRDPDRIPIERFWFGG